MPANQEGMARLQHGIETFRGWVDEKDAQALLEVAGHYAMARADIQMKLDPLLDEIQRARENGEEVTPTQLHKRARYIELMRQVDTSLNKASNDGLLTLYQGVPDYVRQAMKAAKEMTYAGLQDNEPHDKPGAATQVMARWHDVPEDAVTAIIGASNTGVMMDLFQSVAKQGVKDIDKVMTRGVITGKPIAQVTKDFHDKMNGTVARAATIVRTETLRAYREGTRQSYERNSDIVKGWAWRCARTTRCCSVCWAMDGQRFATNAMMHTHVNCRCFMVPVTPTWAELGFTGIKEAPAPVPAGLAFSKLSAADQRRILGPGKYEAYKAGDIKLSDLAGYNVDPRWGGNRYERSLKEAIANKGKPIPGIVPMSKYGNVDLRPKEVPDNMKAAALPKPVSGVGLPWKEAKAKIEDTIARTKLKGINSEQMQNLDYAIRHKQFDIDRAKRGIERAQGDAFLTRVHTEALKEAEDEMRVLRNGRAKLVSQLEPSALSYSEAKKILHEEVLFAPEGHRSSVKPTIVNQLGPKDSVIQEGFDMFNKLVPRNPITTFAKKDVYGIGNGRSNYGQFESNKPINMDRRSDAPVVTHELGHWLEDMLPGLHEDTLDFWKRRTAGVPLTHMGPGYDPHEMTRRDDFVSPYIGKEYIAGRHGQYATEVVSMGIEYFHKDPQYLYENDPDMFEFVYNALRGQTPNAARNSR